jgi:hypothetical protein
MRHVRFSSVPPTGDRIHYVSQADVEVVLSRLPRDLWRRLRGVHFNDRAWGNRWLGYVNSGRHDIALCALPPRLSFGALCRRDRISTADFGAQFGRQWPALAARRFMLYNVLLHEIGHLQVFDAHRPSRRLRFYREKLAQEFANSWRRRLWSVLFDHPDPVHNPPERGLSTQFSREESAFGAVSLNLQPL